jgi:hypothetical protein
MNNRKQLTKLRRSIEKFGFVVPVIVDECNQLLAAMRTLLPPDSWALGAFRLSALDT